MSDAIEAAAPTFQSLFSRELKMRWAVVGSLGVHGVLLGVFIVLSIIEPGRLDAPQKPVSAKLVRLGKARDKTLLPRKEISPPPPPKTVEIPGVAPVAIKARDPSAPPSKKSDPSSKSRSKLFDAFNKTAAKPEELSGDPDGDPDGDSDTAEEGERYFGLILAKARRNYGITKTISPQELVRLKAEVVLFIGPNGDLIREPKIQVSSGNEQFDQDVLLSLRKAAPFGPPPPHLVDILKTVGVAIEARP